MTDRINRRGFLRRMGVATIAGGVTGLSRSVPDAWASGGEDAGFVVDLTRCDGCPDVPVPRCVTACREEKKQDFPQPQEEIMDYWPQDKHEDWSSKKHLTNTLTPYNWTYVQKVSVEHNGEMFHLNIQRRCMHCDHPACAALCPFGMVEKKEGGAVSINPNGCFGGAKCRSVCPWHIPQRQAGVGLYLKMAPKLAGGGVMFKCDMCYERLARNQQPACVEACRARLGEKAPLLFGSRTEMKTYAQKRAEEINGYIYGDKENRGTGTFYVSPVPFEKIDLALRDQKNERFFFPKDPNPLEEPALLAQASLVAPVAAVAGALLTGARVLGVAKAEGVRSGSATQTSTEQKGFQSDEEKEREEDKQ